jgi:glucokinase
VPERLAVEDPARRGDEIALGVLAAADRALGTGLAAAVLLCDPGAVVLDGGVVSSGEPLLGPARAMLRERALGGPPELLMSALAPQAPLYGAAAAAADLLAAQPGG